MPLKTERNKGCCKASIEGDMTIFTAADLKADLLTTLDTCPEIEMDLSEVNEMDTAGFQLLLMMKRETAVLKKPFRIIAYSSATLAVLDLYNMADYFNE